MSRSFVLGMDCKLYFMPATNRVQDTQNPENNRPKQLMTGDPPTYDNSTVSSYYLVRTAQDVTLNMTATTADLTTRYSNGWRQMVSALKEGSIDFSVLWLPDDKDIFGPMLEAFLEQCPVTFAILDGPIEGFNQTQQGACQDGTTSGSQGPIDYSPRCGECGLVTGLHADFIITSFTRNEALEEGVTADVTIEPAVGMIYPEWLVIPTVEVAQP